jgi:hypothetical protein
MYSTQLRTCVHGPKHLFSLHIAPSLGALQPARVVCVRGLVVCVCVCVCIRVDLIQNYTANTQL